MSQRLDHWKLGFNQFRLHLSLRTGLAVHHHTDLLVYPLSRHAPFPFVFPRQVGRVSLRSLLSTSSPCGRNLTCTQTAHGGIDAVAWSPNGERIAAGSWDKQVHVIPAGGLV